MYNRATNMLSYAPDYYQTSKIYRGQNDAKGSEFDIVRTLIDEYIVQLDPRKATWGLVQWEKMCGIQTTPSDNLEQRRTRILSKLMMCSPVTPKLLATQIQTAFGIKIEFDCTSKPYTVTVIMRDDKGVPLIPDFKNLVNELLPAHLSLLIHAYIKTCKVSEFLRCGLHNSTFTCDTLCLIIFSHPAELFAYSIKAMEQFEYSVLFNGYVKNKKLDIDNKLYYSVAIQNILISRSSHVKIKTLIKNHWNGLAALIQDSMYYMDGSVQMDGSRKLNAQIIRSEF